MEITINAAKRAEQGSSASRRLRRAGQVPAIIFGADQDAVAVTLDHNEMYHWLHKEAFHASILNIDVDGKAESVVLRDAQWHPYKQLVLHMDFMRVKTGVAITMKVPLHFTNEEASPGLKVQHGIASHILTEVEISTLPRNLPEFIEVDLTGMNLGDSITLGDLKLPEGVEVVDHGHADQVVVTILSPQVKEADVGEEGEENGEAAGEE
ncbi:50S ribosomal protein L25/general stress protein Ctc [Denitromonas iodatirespirans]|uniref:Large ribosomal subunit protein bL25 n=1 Tax=Denitromonas iodatirespirans TaxID=2795389 RepID=A0A944H6V1_DENI1|nr:50S ribosomal protein L25/general stress protein Ctc [Denitromonas iodatirespirans]MBT0959665.1 50S ribosomal protein L25/general stress protein Ctc [Denitromonas iodatirespirans]